MKKRFLIVVASLVCSVAFAGPEPVGVDGGSVVPGTMHIGATNSTNAAKMLALQADPANSNALLTEDVNLTSGSAVTKINGGPTGAPTVATGQVSVSSSSATQVVATGPTNRSSVIKNTDASITMYVGVSGVTSATGMPLKAGESVSIDTTAAIYCKAASGSPVAAFITVSD
jgi:hypothetical protein